MDEQLNDSDFDVIVDSLKHYKMNIENYKDHPSYEFKQKQLQRVESAMRKIKALQQNLG
ncbi:MAG TPA: hypothetical protein VFR24_05560 [Candidatus Angelobacter sp.]|nr:hypothetical protein [Candidatus Angelobacter sp.]